MTCEPLSIDTGLAIEQLFWWGSWLVPLFRARRRRLRRSPARRPRKSIAAISGCRPGRCPGCSGPPLPGKSVGRSAGKTKRGTSLVAVAQKAATTGHGRDQSAATDHHGTSRK